MCKLKPDKCGMWNVAYGMWHVTAFDGYDINISRKKTLNLRTRV